MLYFSVLQKFLISRSCEVLLVYIILCNTRSASRLLVSTIYRCQFFFLFLMLKSIQLFLILRCTKVFFCPICTDLHAILFLSLISWRHMANMATKKICPLPSQKWFQEDNNVNMSKLYIKLGTFRWSQVSLCVILLLSEALNSKLFAKKKL